MSNIPSTAGFQGSPADRPGTATTFVKILRSNFRLALIDGTTTSFKKGQTVYIPTYMLQPLLQEGAVAVVGAATAPDSAYEASLSEAGEPY